MLIQHAADARVYSRLMLRGRSCQHMGQDPIRAAGMAHADAQAVKCFAAGLVDDIPQAVIAAMTAAGLKADIAGRKVDLVVRDQDLCQRDFIVVKQGGNGRAALVHKGLRLAQAAIHGAALIAAKFGVKFARGGKSYGALGGQRVNKPETRVVPGAGVLRAGVAEADDQFERGRHVAVVSRLRSCRIFRALLQRRQRLPRSLPRCHLRSRRL